MSDETEARAVNVRKLVNTILARHFASFMPDVVERVRVGNAACTELIAGLATQPPAAQPVDAMREMTREEHRLEDLKQMAAYSGPIVSFDFREPYYLASCDHCGWVGSSELCGTDSYGDDSDVYCPRCQSSGADCGKVAAMLAASPTPPAEHDVEAAVRSIVASTGGKCWEDFGAVEALRIAFKAGRESASLTQGGEQ